MMMLLMMMLLMIDDVADDDVSLDFLILMLTKSIYVELDCHCSHQSLYCNLQYGIT